MTNLYVGQKVVCINAQPQSPEFNELDGLTEGAVYTIRAIGWTPEAYCMLEPVEDPTWDVWLEEITRGSYVDEEYDGDWPELGFLASRFRPVVNTDISVFTAMLAPARDRACKIKEASA